MQSEVNARYLGLRLSSPIVVGACPLTRQNEYVRQLAIAGAGAVVLPSLFQEQIVNYLIATGVRPGNEEEQAELRGYACTQDGYNGGPESYLNTIRDLKHSVGIPIIANLNGFTAGRWLQFSREIQRAGADAIELSFHTDCTDPGLSADQIEQKLLDCVGQVTDNVTIPVSVKVTPYFSSLSNLAWRLVEVGARGIVVFGHDPIWETQLDRLTATTRWALTPSGNIQPTIAGLIRARGGGPNVCVAASGGISGPNQVIQVVLAGADVAMVTSEIYREGPDAVAHMIDGVRSYVQRSGFDSFESLLQARPAMADPIDQRLNLLNTMTKPESYLDPTPKVTNKVGDRSGHLQREHYR